MARIHPLLRRADLLIALSDETARRIHPLIRGAASSAFSSSSLSDDSSPHTRGKRPVVCLCCLLFRFIPSYEGQTIRPLEPRLLQTIHPFLRRANLHDCSIPEHTSDSSLPAKGRHSVFMRLLAALNTSLYNLHKCHSRFIHIFNIPKNPPHFHFF